MNLAVTMCGAATASAAWGRSLLNARPMIATFSSWLSWRLGRLATATGLPDRASSQLTPPSAS
jgi:hypothetical protein